MAIVNGTFDNNINGWNNNNASAYEVEVVWDGGRARLTKRGSDRLSGCDAPWMNQRFLIDRDFLSFDWQTYKSWTGPDTLYRWSLVIHAPGGDIALVPPETLPSPYYTGYLSGSKNINVSTYKGLEATIQFWYAYGGCTQSWAINHMWIDNIILYSLTCPSIPKYSGNTITLQATPKDGIGPYIVTFKKDDNTIDPSRFEDQSNPINNTSENETITRVYTLNDVDIANATGGIITFSVLISDSCPTGAQTCTESCIINVGCVAPVCNFIVS